MYIHLEQEWSIALPASPDSIVEGKGKNNFKPPRDFNLKIEFELDDVKLFVREIGIRISEKQFSSHGPKTLTHSPSPLLNLKVSC